ncbi:MAG: excinuclease ABC subunit UvrC [Hahellaceae bacterium]|nr:excinuclease ABC subunit UvrC [Hahellaceae bacterium]
MVDESSFDAGAFLKRLTTRPGIYRMLDRNGGILYVGKAKNLKNRVSSYFRSQQLPVKTQALVSKIQRIEVTVTPSEAEALLLEQSLIKSERPPYNILLRDDKSYPYIFRSGHDDYPSLTFRRARQRKKGKGQFFGPYTSSAAVREALNFLQKTFRIRQCDDSFYSNRSRPCLQHQIGRCSAPCVGLISPEAYQDDMRHAELFLEGKKPDLIQSLIRDMETAAADLQFERAATLRDQIAALRQVQSQQTIEGVERDIDVFALAAEAGEIFIHGLFIREGNITGTKTFHFTETLEGSPAEALSAFLGQFYLGGHTLHGFPQEVIVSDTQEDLDSLREALFASQQRRIRFSAQVRSDRADWLKIARTNAQQALRSHLQTEDAQHTRWTALCTALQRESLNRAECFDISHTQGEATVASCVAFDATGARKDLYRRFNIQGITGGDDYAAMEQALTRHYSRLRDSELGLPDLVLIDGGLGQLGVAEAVFKQLDISPVRLIGVAKGVTRKAGFETLIRGGDHSVIHLPPDAAALHLIQHVRDEAHRFAITGHRQQRNAKRSQSVLETITGIGPKRRREILNYFGSLKALERASIDDIKRVPGLSDALAETIYAALHE